MFVNRKSDLEYLRLANPVTELSSPNNPNNTQQSHTYRQHLCHLDMAHGQTAIAASDARAVSKLYAQIRSNQKAMHFQRPLPNMLTQFRTDHARDVTIAHPVQHILPSFPEGNSPSISAAIWLYSRFISYALPIFHTLLHREPELTPRDGASEPPVWLYPEPLQDLTQEQEDYTWTFLGRIGPKLKWIVDEDGANGIQGWTRRCRDLPLLSESLEGCGSIIATAASEMQVVEDAFQYGTIEDHKEYSFDLAVLWLHELSHAIVLAVVPRLEGAKNEAVYLGPDASTSEDGFEVENRLFGGRLSGCSERKLNAKKVLQEWPDVKTIRVTREAGFMLLTRGSAESLTREWTIRWKVEPSYWERMFEDGFWTKGLVGGQSKNGSWRKDLVDGRSGALWPDKSIGGVYHFDGGEQFEEEKEILERELEIEGYERRRNGLFVRKGLEFETEAMYEPDSDGTDETDSDGMGNVEMGDFGDVKTGESEDAEMTDAE
ncbi:unnamed protein product [Zymoseptoria tritici ST99CH_1A5]|uniref:Uncharacterized protein n=1 Tax=Zymoseptoria tritici ST99CH_1A5 TaxID=1276529 RepID=A0A1Y6LAT1_ZYMTR|nr:unnamed protein product [Zymoseptoria tritici ST99CH_1A5]